MKPSLFGFPNQARLRKTFFEASFTSVFRSLLGVTVFERTCLDEQVRSIHNMDIWL